ncbi:MAG: M23 family metallopeptidase [Oscillospiraceae bacterium]|nr:M23 family metallopeptidase [Oscillospiraceae bacterium]
MNSSSSGRRLEKFLSGKGFYIVLFLCAAVIGVSAWMVAAGNETMKEDLFQSVPELGTNRVETVIIPSRPGREQTLLPELEETAPSVSTDGLAAAEPVDKPDGQAVEASAPVYVWPVSGELVRPFSGDRLAYDRTMRDWRTHEGVDIAAEPGCPVTAARAGTVESVRQDDLYGTVVTVDHGDGSRAIYANLEAQPPVEAGQRVEAGQIIGAVGSTALCEVAQEPHLHFALQVNGRAADPASLLPG